MTNIAKKLAFTQNAVQPAKSTLDRIQGSFSYIFPFRSFLSLRMLVEDWTGPQAMPASIFISKEIARLLENAPEFKSNNLSLNTARTHQDLLDLLMSGLFASQERNYERLAALCPYSTAKIYSTPLFDDVRLKKIEQSKLARLKTIMVYSQIFRSIFGFEVACKFPAFTVSGEQPLTGKKGYFQIDIDNRYCWVERIAGPAHITPEQKARILNSLDNIDVWMDILPPQNFALHGFFMMRISDVTEHAAISAIRRILIARNALLEQKNFLRLQELVNQLLERDNLKIAISSFVSRGDKQEVIRYSGIDGHEKCDDIYRESVRFEFSDFDESLYCKASRVEGSIVIPDMQTYPTATGIDQRLKDKRVRTVVITGLRHDGEVIGFFDIVAMEPDQLSYLTIEALTELQPIFAIAVKQIIEDVQNNVQSIIRTQCTAIHPTVEWRFHQAAMNSLRRSHEVDNHLHDHGLDHEDDHHHNHHAETVVDLTMEPIVFNDVYPLYGISDIRSSSTLRNQSIQRDLLRQLDLAHKVLELALHDFEMPFLREILFRLNRSYQRISDGLTVGEELSVFQFLHQDVETSFDTLAELNPQVREAIALYRSSLSQELGMIYESRRDYEESVTLLNTKICTLLDAEHAEAQNMFPHYFEKQSTDGVDHSIYVGQSLVSGRKFAPLHLYNLRLWQLQLLCKTSLLAHRIQNQLKVPLQLAHLVAVQGHPISIRFDYDEKQFGVEGAYNIRYEILKKRIDKAVVKSTGERLTQPDYIAIVYSQDVERIDYIKYIDFLIAEGYLRGEPEDLVLGDLQGIHGLRALRIAVNLDSV